MVNSERPCVTKKQQHLTLRCRRRLLYRHSTPRITCRAEVNRPSSSCFPQAPRMEVWPREAGMSRQRLVYLACRRLPTVVIMPHNRGLDSNDRKLELLVSCRNGQSVERQVRSTSRDLVWLDLLARSRRHPHSSAITPFEAHSSLALQCYSPSTSDLQ